MTTNTSKKATVKPLVKKARIYSHNVNGQTVKTTCKVFGAPILDEENNLVDKCSLANCTQSEEVRAHCMLNIIKPMTFEEIFKEVSKKRTGKKSSSSAVKDDSIFISYVQAFKANKSKAEILEMMKSNGMVEKASKTLFSKLSCVTGAILRPNLKDSTIYQVARFVVHNSEVKPVGDKSSIAFCTRVCNAWLANEVQILDRDK